MIAKEVCKCRACPPGERVTEPSSPSQVIALRRSTACSVICSRDVKRGAETLRGLSKLEILDLADNNIWGLPLSTLCATPSLRTLNLTLNNIVEVSEVELTSLPYILKTRLNVEIFINRKVIALAKITFLSLLTCNKMLYLCIQF